MGLAGPRFPHAQLPRGKGRVAETDGSRSDIRNLQKADAEPEEPRDNAVNGREGVQGKSAELAHENKMF